MISNPNFELIQYIDTKLVDSAQNLLRSFKIEDGPSIQKRTVEIQAWLDLKDSLLKINF